MIIGMDVDGVLADFNHDFMEVMARITGRDLFPPGYQPTSWNYPQSVGYTEEELGRVWRSIEQNQHFWEHLPPYEWTADIIAALRYTQRASHPVYFVTSRPGRSARFQTEKWLNRHGFPAPTVLVGSQKGLAAQLLNMDVYADDKTENCQDTARFCRTYMIAQPWNADTDGVTRIPPTDLAKVIGGF